MEGKTLTVLLKSCFLKGKMHEPHTEWLVLLEVDTAVLDQVRRCFKG